MIEKDETVKGSSSRKKTRPSRAQVIEKDETVKGSSNRKRRDRQGLK